MAGFGGGGGKGATLCAAAADAPGAALALAAGPVGFAFVAVETVFLQVGKLRASRHGTSANRMSIKQVTPYR